MVNMPRHRQDLKHQLFYAHGELKRHGIPVDIHDLAAQIDITLTYTENRKQHILPIIEEKSITLRLRKAERQWHKGR